MKKIAIFCLLLLISQLAIAQKYTIKGRILDGQTLSPLPGVDIGFNYDRRTSTDKNGDFELVIEEDYLNDTLFINLLNYYNLKIINIPKEEEVNLGQIPLYEYIFSQPLVQFNCGMLDFKCKQNRKQYWKEYNKKKREYFEEKNALIGYYRLLFNGVQYPIDIEKHLLNLKIKRPPTIRTHN